MHMNTHKTCEFQLHFRVDLPVPHLPPSLSFKQQTQVANILMKDKPNNLAVPSLFHFSNFFFKHHIESQRDFGGFCFNGEAKIC